MKTGRVKQLAYLSQTQVLMRNVEEMFKVQVKQTLGEVQGNYSKSSCLPEYYYQSYVQYPLV